MLFRALLSQACRIAALVVICCTQTTSHAQTGSFANGPKTIAAKERVSVTIDREVREAKSFIVLKISVPTDSKVNAFLLADPARVVVDFDGASIKKSDNFPAPENGVIKQIRLGAHPSKLRVVIDLVSSTPPTYEWKAEKRQATISFFEGPAAAPPTPQLPPAAQQPTAVPSIPATAEPTPSATALPAVSTPSALPTEAPIATSTPEPSAAKNTSDAPGVGGAAASLPQTTGMDVQDDEADLGDLEEARSGPPPTRVPTTFTIQGYSFEYLSDKSPVLKIQLNKPRAQAQISKVDSETYKIEIKDCGVANEEIELPQFPPHDFVGFVMVVAEVAGKNTEVSVSVEEDFTLGTSVQGNEIWVKKQ